MELRYCKQCGCKTPHVKEGTEALVRKIGIFFIIIVAVLAIGLISTIISLKSIGSSGINDSTMSFLIIIWATIEIVVFVSILSIAIETSHYSVRSWQCLNCINRQSMNECEFNEEYNNGASEYNQYADPLDDLRKGMNSYFNKDYTEAKNKFEICSGKGDIRADVMLAMMYLHGEGVKKSVADAEILMKSIFNKCQNDELDPTFRKYYADCLYELGECYQNGCGIKTSNAVAKFYYGRAERFGNESAALKIEEINNKKLQ